MPISPNKYVASDAERKEVDDLQALFGKTSEVPRGLFLKFEVSRANREIADREREAKEQRQALMEQRAEDQRRRIEQLRQVRGERDRDAVNRLHARNRANAMHIKAQEQAWEENVLQQRNTLKKKVKDGGSADFHNARLADLEAKMLQDRRDKAQAEYDAHKKLARETYEKRMADRRKHAGDMRQSVEDAHSGANSKLAHMKGTQAGEARAMKNAWKRQFEENEQARLQRARDNRRHAEEVRARARQNMENQKNRRQKAGSRMQRQVDEDAERAKNELMAYKRKLRQQSYNHRYVGREDAEKLAQSTFRKLYSLSAPTGSPNASQVS